MKKKYYLWVLGCQMNKSDAERVSAVLNKLGYQEVKSEKEADVVLTLACSVRQSAIDRIYGKAKIWEKIKKTKPLITILSGCVLAKDKVKMVKNFDLIFDIKDLSKLSALLTSRKFSFPLPKNDYFKIHPSYQTNFQAYVPISTGCNNFCTYCVVPYVRGSEKSRKASEIITECQNLIARGYKEITLLGQNVNSYGKDLKSNLNFPALLQKIAHLKGDFWLRFVTSHPKDLSNQLIEVITSNNKICNYLHLPVQAGDNTILKKMNRKYSREYYIKLINKIRKNIPDIAISTDIIVGFPGETKKQFQNTVKLFKEVKFDMAYIAQYSPRPGTGAYELKDDVPKIEKQRREKILTAILKETALEQNKKLIGKDLKVLIENKKGNVFFGKTETFKTVKIATTRAAVSTSRSKAGQALNSGLAGDFINISPAPGQWCWVKITKAKDFGLEGILLK